MKAWNQTTMEAPSEQQNGWKTVPIKDIAEINPKLDKSAIPDKLMVSFVPMQAVGTGDGTIDVSNLRHAAEVKKGFTNFQEGDVLFAKITPCMENGKMAVVPKVASGYGFGSTEFHVLRPKNGLDPRYLYYFVSSQSVRKEAAHNMTGAVGQKRVSTSYIADLEIPLAPPDQQRLIVAEIEKQFSRLDEAVVNLKRIKANLKRYKAAVLKDAVEGRLVETEAALARREGRIYETGEQLLKRILEARRNQWKGRGKYKEPAAPDKTDLPGLPEGWVWATADQLMSLITDGEHITPRRSDAGVLLLSARNVLNGKLDFSDVDYVPEEEHLRISKRLSVGVGDVLLSCSGSVGRSCVVPAGVRFSLVRSVAVLRPLVIRCDFVCYQIQSLWLQAQIESLKTQTAQANIFQGKIRQLIFALPPKAEQDRIVAEVDRHLSILGDVAAEVDINLLRTERLRQSVLMKAFSGGLFPV